MDAASRRARAVRARAITAYHEGTRARPASPLVERAIRLVRGGEALELGSGGGVDARRLVAAGFHVTAVDVEPSAARHVADLPPRRRRFVGADLTEFPLMSYDLISAQYTLPFVGRARLPRILRRLSEALRPGGVLVAQLFGPRHEWNRPRTGLAFHRRAEVGELLHGLELLALDERLERASAAGAVRPVRWHVFDIVARRPAATATLGEVMRYRCRRVIDAFVARFRVPRREADRLFRELLKLLWLTHHGGSITLFHFHQPLDELWHTFILDTRAYERFCRRYFGTLIHHVPAPPARRRIPLARQRAQLGREIERVYRHLGRATARLWYEIWPVRYPRGVALRASGRAR